MKEILEGIIRELVDNKDAVRVDEIQDPSAFIFEINVAQEDVGKVIGKSGRTANAIRTLVNAMARKHGRGAKVRFNDGKA